MRDFNRNSRSNNRRGGNRPEMHSVTCDECGDRCEVPFKPTGNKPIFCSKCFENQGGPSSRKDNSRRDRGRDRSFSRPNSRDREMHQAICDECGEKCEIPFKPSSDKPIYCSNCFSKKNEGNSRRGGRGDDFGKQLQAINEKLDEILQTLSSSKPKKKVVAKKKVIKKPAKKKTVKKVVKKKASPKKKITKKK